MEWPFTRLLSAEDELQLVLDFVDDDDCFPCALVCKQFHSLVRRSPGGKGWCTRTRAATVSVPRAEWAVAAGCPLRATMCRQAASSGNLHVLMWLRDHACPWDDSVLVAAAHRGHLDVLSWAVEHACPWTPGTPALLTWAAAEGGHPESLHFCSERGLIHLSKYISWLAARLGHLEVVRTISRLDCPLDTYTSLSAAINGHLEVLIWLVDHGCPCNMESVLNVAVANGHTHIAEWVRGQWLAAAGPIAPTTAQALVVADAQ